MSDEEDVINAAVSKVFSVMKRVRKAYRFHASFQRRFAEDIVKRADELCAESRVSELINFIKEIARDTCKGFVEPEMYDTEMQDLGRSLLNIFRNELRKDSSSPIEVHRLYDKGCFTYGTMFYTDFEKAKDKYTEMLIYGIRDI